MLRTVIGLLLFGIVGLLLIGVGFYQFVTLKRELRKMKLIRGVVVDHKQYGKSSSFFSNAMYSAIIEYEDGEKKRRFTDPLRLSHRRFKKGKMVWVYVNEKNRAPMLKSFFSIWMGCFTGFFIGFAFLATVILFCIKIHDEGGWEKLKKENQPFFNGHHTIR